MKRGKEVAGRLRDSQGGGIPWMAILDGEGKKLVTSDGPQGNIGYPGTPAEIAWFLEMLKKAGRPDAGRIAEIGKALEEAAGKLKLR
jgi:hypothetical protein